MVTTVKRVNTHEKLRRKKIIQLYPARSCYVQEAQKVRSIVNFPILIVLLTTVFISACNSTKNPTAEAPTAGGGNNEKASATFTSELIQQKFSLAKALSLRDADKENYKEKVADVEIEYTKYTYGIQNNKLMKTADLNPEQARCQLVSSISSRVRADDAVLEEKANLILSTVKQNSNSKEINGVGTSDSNLYMEMSYGEKNIATALKITCLQVNNIEDLKKQLGDLITIQPNEAQKNQ